MAWFFAVVCSVCLSGEGRQEQGSAREGLCQDPHQGALHHNPQVALWRRYRPVDRFDYCGFPDYNYYYFGLGWNNVEIYAVLLVIASPFGTSTCSLWLTHCLLVSVVIAS